MKVQWDTIVNESAKRYVAAQAESIERNVAFLDMLESAPLEAMLPEQLIRMIKRLRKEIYNGRTELADCNEKRLKANRTIRRMRAARKAG